METSSLSRAEREAAEAAEAVQRTLARRASYSPNKRVSFSALTSELAPRPPERRKPVIATLTCSTLSPVLEQVVGIILTKVWYELVKQRVFVPCLRRFSPEDGANRCSDALWILVATTVCVVLLDWIRGLTVAQAHVRREKLRSSSGCSDARSHTRGMRAWDARHLDRIRDGAGC